MSGETIVLSPDLRRYLLSVGVREDPVSVRLREETARLGGPAGMQISPEQGALMGLITALVGARTVVEVGTFTGYSALQIARALPADGTLICCDVSEDWAAIGRPFWTEAGVADRIDLRIAPALETLEGLAGSAVRGHVDLGFIDADKRNYRAYYEALMGLLRPGGLILIDNVLWGGSVIDPDNGHPDTLAIRELNAFVAADARVDVAMVPIGDGLTFARKR